MANLDRIFRGLEAPNCQLQSLDLCFDLIARHERDFASLFEAARCCQSLKAVKVAVEGVLINNYDLDIVACQALSNLLRSSLVLATLGLHCFSFSLRGFGVLVSGLASCKTVISLQLQRSTLSFGSFDLLRSRLDDLTHLEQLILDVWGVENPELLRLLSDASRKRSRLRSLHLEN